MLVIRLFRVGKKNQPFFKIVVTDKRKPPRGGRFAEQVGSFDSRTKKRILKADKIKYWIGVGAQPSATVYNLLLTEKIIEGKKIPLHKIAKKEEVKDAAKEAQAPAASKAEEVKKESKPEAPKEEPKTKEEVPKA